MKKMKDANRLNSEIEEKHNNGYRNFSMINIDEEKWCVCASSSSDLL